MPLFAEAQTMVTYYDGFEFDNGIYVEFSDFKNNHPIPVTHIISTLDIRDDDYLDQVLSYDSVKFFNKNFDEVTMAVKDLWGYCQNGRVYLAFGEEQSFDNPEFFDFYPLLNVGAYSYFSAQESYYRTMNAGPQMGFGMGMGMRDPMMMNDMTVTESGRVQLLLEFESGRVFLVGRGYLKTPPIALVDGILAKDASLQSEFRRLSSKEQKQKGMFFIRRFNERNPIKVPVYK